MPTITVKAPSTAPQGSPYIAEDGTLYTIGAGGLVTIDTKYLLTAIKAGFTIPNSFAVVTSNVTANANGAQANGTPLSYGMNQIATAANASGTSSALLPAAVPGEYVTVVNDAANGVTIFGTGSDIINGLASATTGLPVQANAVLTFSCVVAGQWRVTPGFGFDGALPTIGSVAFVTAAGANQAAATPVTSRLNIANSVPAANDGVILVAAAAGVQQTVVNGTANALKVYPQANDSIFPNAANTAVTVAANSASQFTAANGGPGTWYQI